MSHKRSIEKIRCLIRQEPVPALPEELVRQKLLWHLINQLKFPAELISVEKKISEMPHLKFTSNLPNRRTDIVCFAKDVHPKHAIYPILVIECKAVKITPKVVNQVVGYNHYLDACFIAVANDQETKFGWQDKASKSYQFIDYIPQYQNLKKSIIQHIESSL